VAGIPQDWQISGAINALERKLADATLCKCCVVALGRGAGQA